MTRKRKRRNAGSFKKGFDPRRHELTKEERSRGFRNALLSVTPKVRRHLRAKVLWWYAKLRKKILRGRERQRTRPKPTIAAEPPW